MTTVVCVRDSSDITHEKPDALVFSMPGTLLLPIFKSIFLEVQFFSEFASSIRVASRVTKQACISVQRT